jgi:hypothetical protein
MYFWFLHLITRTRDDEQLTKHKALLVLFLISLSSVPCILLCKLSKFATHAAVGYLYEELCFLTVLEMTL